MDDQERKVINFAAAVEKLGRSVPAPKPTLVGLAPRWIADRKADNRRPRGVKSYEEVFARFLVFAGEETPITGFTEELVKDYKRDLMTRVAPATARHALTVVRAFGDWAVAENLLPSNPALRVPHPRVEPPDPDPLAREQITELLHALSEPGKTHKATWRRNRRAVFLMVYAGLRLTETAGIERRDLDLDRRTITVRREVAKGGRPRVVSMSQELAVELEHVRSYQGSWSVVDQGDTEAGRGRPLTFKSLSHLFERYLARRLSFPLHPHQLRKTFATELYVRGEELATIQRLLGHTDPKTTMRYIGASSSKERAAVERLTFAAEAEAAAPGAQRDDPTA
jgi:site-specific recombinase XerD